MRLLDQVAQKPEPILVHQSDGAELSLPGVSAVAGRLQNCYLRYVLDDEVARTCADVAFAAGMLEECCDIVAAPADSVWIEYEHAARMPVLEETGLAPANQPSPPHRVGMLARCRDSSNRAGEIMLVWENCDGLGPEVCPIWAQFDLDAPDFAAGQTGPAPLHWRPDLPHLNELIRRMRFHVDPHWDRYYRTYAPNVARYDDVLTSNMMYWFGDAPMCFALFLLIMSGKALRGVDVVRDRLNRSRVRSGKAPLLDHVEIKMNLFSAASTEAEGMHAAARQAPRLHLVRGHLVRRRDRVFWRSSHLRGNAAKGEVKHRTVLVGMGRS